MYAKVTSLGVTGLAGYIVQVEADLSGGLPQFNLVGLPDSAVKESSERVRSAIKNLHYEWPASRITINLAPADVRKTGPVYDLPVFVGILAAQGKLPVPGSERAFLGELGLDGTLRPVTGVLPMALAAVQKDYDFIFVDCPPSLDLLTLNGLCACDSVLIPIQCEYYALEGLSELISTLKTIRKKYNPYLDIEGVVFTMFSVRYNLTLQVVDQVKKYFGSKVYKTTIPRTIRISEAPSYGQPINFYEPKGKGSEAYMDLAIEFVKNNRPHEPARRRTKGNSAPAEQKSALEQVKQGEA